MSGGTADWRDTFCGRKQELGHLLEAFQEVAAGEGPRLAVVLGDRGMGKTRLVQELYRTLTTTCDPDNYWPNASSFVGDNLRVAPGISDPDVREHFESFRIGDRRMPFLWWGFRLSDPDIRNAVRSDMAAHRATLDIHLGPLRFERLLGSKRRELAAVGADVAGDAGKKALVEALKQIPGFGLGVLAAELLLDHSQAVKRTADAVQQHRQLTRDFRQRTAVDEGAHRTADIHERTLEDMCAMLAPTSADPEPGIPCVVFCDDAQFARESGDEGAHYFLQQLWQRAKAGRWPLLLVLTHWTIEWAEGSSSRSDDTLAGSLSADAAAAGIGRTIELGGEPELINIVHAGLPGLPDDDCQLLLDKADGNPQVIIELVLLARRSPAWRRPGDGAFTPSARAQIQAHSADLVGLIYQRMVSESTPESVRQAAAISSVQGMEFLSSLTRAVADALEITSAEDAIVEARDRHRLVVDVENDVYSFVQRAYHEASKRLLGGHVADPSEVEGIVLANAIAIADGAGAWDGMSAKEQSATLRILAGLAERDADPAIRLRGGRALVQLVDLGVAGQDYATAAAYAKRFEAGIGLPGGAGGPDPAPLWSLEKFPLDDLARLVAARQAWEGPRDLLPFTAAVCEAVRKAATDSGTPDAHWALSNALLLVADVLREQGAMAEAEAHCVEALELARGFAAALGTDDAKHQLSSILARTGDVLSVRGNVAGAKDHYTESLQLMRAQAGSSDPIYRYNLSDTLNRAADEFLAAGDFEAAESHYRESLGLKRGLVRDLGDHRSRESLAHALVLMGSMLSRKGDPAGAGQHLEEALELHRELARTLDTVAARQGLSATLHRLAGTYADQGDPVRASACAAESLALDRSLVLATGTTGALGRLGTSLMDMADLLAVQGDMEGAQAHLAEAVDLCRTVAEASDTPHSRQILSDGLCAMGSLAVVRGDMATATPLCGECVALRRELVSELGTLESQSDLREALVAMASVLQLTGNSEGLEAVLAENLALSRRLVEAVPAPANQNQLADVLMQLGVMLRSRQDTPGAKAHLGESLAILRPLVDAHGVLDEEVSLSVVLNQLGELALDEGDLAAAEGFLLESIARQRSLGDAIGVFGRTPFATTIWNLGKLQRAWGDAEGARVLYSESLDILRQSAASTARPDLLFSLARVLTDAGDLFADCGNPAEAERHYREGADTARALFQRLDSPAVRLQLEIAENRLGTITPT